MRGEFLPPLPPLRAWDARRVPVWPQLFQRAENSLQLHPSYSPVRPAASDGGRSVTGVAHAAKSV